MLQFTQKRVVWRRRTEFIPCAAFFTAKRFSIKQRTEGIPFYITGVRTIQERGHSSRQTLQ